MLNKNNLLAGILIILTLVGLIGQWTSYSATILQLTPIHLLITTSILIYSQWKIPIKTAVLLLGIVFLGFIIEVLGVKTGNIFGVYHYGSTLGPKLWEVPFMIGVNWLALTYSSQLVSYHFVSNKFFRPIAGAFVMVIIDLLMEPLCSSLDFWYWHIGSAPLQNFMAWFAIAYVFQVLLSINYQPAKNKIPFLFIFLQFLFFLCLNLK